MEYTETTIKDAMLVLNNLIEKGEILKEEDRDLYASYRNDEDVRSIISICEEVMKIQVFDSNEGVYFVPNVDNYVFGYKTQLLKDTVLRTVATKHKSNEYVGLMNFIILTILNYFYKDGKKTTNTLTLDKLQSKVGDELEKAKMNDDLYDDEKGLYERLYTDFNNMKSCATENGPNRFESPQKETIEYFIKAPVELLKSQGLVSTFGIENMFQPTDKLNTIMERYILNKEFKDVRFHMLGEDNE